MLIFMQNLKTTARIENPTIVALLRIVSIYRLVINAGVKTDLLMFHQQGLEKTVDQVIDIFLQIL